MKIFEGKESDIGNFLALSDAGETDIVLHTFYTCRQPCNSADPIASKIGINNTRELMQLPRLIAGKWL